ncbi:50S ribosomal protein L6 [Mucisphaera calidilacus]|uniref:50S ribosomal protein L6 n=1 Tax=Mucisphaera calidilacus TaxID=2527982 RepID=A0A518BXQ8_9BACT|nr:50S ribosomal protein L6 [Mucisphaera calidilacus]QDU71761.1 50S ribosomal protein L6 [Mucisphaera calidilacus]
MSRIGKKPVPIEGGAKVTVSGREIVVEAGGKRLSYEHRPEVSVSVDDENKQVVVERADDSRTAKSMHGLTRALIANMIEGVTKGYKRDLEIVGVGWNAKVQGRQVNLKLGYADTRVVKIPDGVEVAVDGQKLSVTGPDKMLVGQTAAAIRQHRKPEPYNGKGVRYAGEQIIRKAGKAFGN